jgi:iron complex transport system permease protein
MDDLARTLMPNEIPVGLLTSAMGAPVFAFFFVKLKGQGFKDD